MSHSYCCLPWMTMKSEEARLSVQAYVKKSIEW